MYNEEIIAYAVSEHPNMNLIRTMMKQAYERLSPEDEVIFHSDQGWQYQQKSFQKELLDHNIKQSMSRKGNCLDNSIIENFFGRMKTEMFYNQRYESIDELIEAIHEYIYYYNNTRIKSKLKGLSPIEYRTQSYSFV